MWGEYPDRSLVVTDQSGQAFELEEEIEGDLSGYLLDGLDDDIGWISRNSGFAKKRSE